MLLQFPPEITTAIFAHLSDDNDLLSTRLVCRSISALVRPRFLEHFFTTVETRLCESSLERLETIASIEDYRNAVMLVELDPRSFRFGQGLAWPRNDDLQLLQEGPNTERVRKIVTDSFPRCSKLRIIADENKHWPDYWRDTEYLTLPDVIGQVFAALASLPTHRLESITMEFNPRYPEYCLDGVSPSTYNSDAFWKAWSKLKALRLNMERPETAKGTDLLQNLLRKAKNLEKLALKAIFYDMEAIQVPLYEQLGPFETSSLSHLVLEQARFQTSTSLVTFLKQFRESLQFLSLSFILLNNEGGWKDTCAAMRGQFPRLRRFLLEIPRAPGEPRPVQQLMCPLRIIVPDAAREDFDFIEFHDRRLRRFYCVSGVRYAGPDVDMALELIERSLYAAGSPPAGLEPYELPPGLTRGRVLDFKDPNKQF